MKTLQVSLTITVLFFTLVSGARNFCYVLRFLFIFQISLLTIVMFYELATNSELANIEPWLLRDIQG